METPNPRSDEPDSEAGRSGDPESQPQPGPDVEQPAVPPPGGPQSQPTNALDPLAAERMRAEARLTAMKGASPARSRTGCQAMIWGGVVLLWATLAWLIWFDEPDRLRYEPANPSGERVAAAVHESHVLPQDWTTVRPRYEFASDSASLEVSLGTARDLGMSPRTVTGQPMTGSYTAAAYANTLHRRFRDSELYASRYIDLGDRAGVEAVLQLPDGRWVRGFALVDERMNAVEWVFTLPQGPGSPAWQEAETIFRSVRHAQPLHQPRPTAAEPTPASPSPAPTPAAGAGSGETGGP